MQGRLLPKYRGRFQAHPVGYWKDEFPIARDLGLDCIEFIFDFNNFRLNPIWTDSGINEIKKISLNTGIDVYSICADFFMECPFHADDIELRKLANSVATDLIKKCGDLGVSNLVIPCVDHSSLKTPDEINIFTDEIQKVIPYAETFGVNLALETDLNPSEFKGLLTQLNSSSVKVNYDCGNSASLGYDFKKELEAYGSKISDLHIKDRIRGGGSVFLGLGAAKIKEFVEAFVPKFNFNGPVILQLYRDEEGLSVFKQQFKIFKNLINEI